MTLTVKDVLDGNYQPTTLSQGIVMGRIQELANEGSELEAELRRCGARMPVVKALIKELLSLLEDMPDAALEDSNPTLVDDC